MQYGESSGFEAISGQAKVVSSKWESLVALLFFLLLFLSFYFFMVKYIYLYFTIEIITGCQLLWIAIFLTKVKNF